MCSACVRSTDVLVLGAGLAGLRAALSCLQADPGLHVLVVSATSGPSGSSFANQNNALGIHACLTQSQRQAYIAEVLALNAALIAPQVRARQEQATRQRPQPPDRSTPPHRKPTGAARPEAVLPQEVPLWSGPPLLLDPHLVSIQAQEGAQRLADLADLGCRFERSSGNALVPRSSCFSPQSRRAYVFTDLAQAHGCFMHRLQERGCAFLHGWQAVALTPQSAATGPGAFLVQDSGGEPTYVAAKAVIVALGGPARLFAHCMAGPNPGYSHGLLLEAGAAMANLGLLQFMWGTVPEKQFWQPAATGADGYALLAPADRFSQMASRSRQQPPGQAADTTAAATESLAAHWDALCAQRAGHCPFGYGLEDAVLDLTLAQAMDSNGCVCLRGPGGERIRVAPMAHASNGGAVIDENARTTLPGILACGECATGMHGANRLGGAMVLACQVFGHRAGLEAARLAGGQARVCRPKDVPPPGVLESSFAADAEERRQGLAWLAQGLSERAVLGGRPGADVFLRQVRESLATARDRQLVLSLLTAAGILESLPYRPMRPPGRQGI